MERYADQSYDGEESLGHQPEHHHRQGAGSGGHDHASSEERYQQAPSLWSGQANPPLVQEAGDLALGRALDVGCGQGGDILWLAAQGWDATGLDFSQVALDRAAEHAAVPGRTDGSPGSSGTS